jgi:hypothetical protein
MLPALSGIVQLACLVLFAVEVWRYHTLRSRTSWGVRVHTIPSFDPTGLPATMESERFVFRWDAEQQVLRFRRRFGVVSGEWGHAGGGIRPDGTVRWQPFPLSLVWIVAAFALYGTTVLAVLEAEPLVVLANPLVWLFCTAFYWMQVRNGRGLLERHLEAGVAGVLPSAQGR